MAYVIAICGSGGKTTLAFNKANVYKNEGKKVCIITTTHMWFEDSLVDINDIKEKKIKITNDRIFFIGKKIDEKICVVDNKDYEYICENFDIVIIEADGSRGMPIKIPRLITEPVIPENVSEIIIVYGLQSLGRKLGPICHRFNELSFKLKELDEKDINENTIVTKDLLLDFYKHFYEKPLKEKFRNVKISLFLTDMTKSENYKKYKEINFVLCASGFSKRFGDNKLLTKISGKEIYKWTLENIIEAKNILIKKLKDDFQFNLKVNVLCVSQYDEIINNKEYKDIIYIKNNNADLGLSESLKLGLKFDENIDAICFFNADLPKLSSKEIAMMIYYYLLNFKNMGSMAIEKRPTNPAIFNKKYYKDILNLEGDTGLRDIIRNNGKDLFKYFIDKNELIDIDTKEDLKDLEEEKND